MKLTEGLFKRVFEEMAPEYPEIQAEHLIIDNVAHQMAKNPTQFDIIVTTNLNGDIISDLASGLVGGLGFASSGNYGDGIAIFEAVHGSAPKYAGKDVINPTALILSSVMMLRHLGQVEAAAAIEDAVLCTLEEGRAVTQDLARQTGGDVEHAASTTGFTDQVIANLGRHPTSVPVRVHASDLDLAPRPGWSYGPERYTAMKRDLVGVDVMIETDLPVDELGDDLGRLAGDALQLAMVESRGTKVYPSIGLATDHVRWYRGRFVAREGRTVSEGDLVGLLGRIAARHRWTEVLRLQSFDGEPAYTKAQGE